MVVLANDVARNSLNVIRQANRLAGGQGRCVVNGLIGSYQAPFRLFRSVRSLGIRCVKVNAIRSNQLVHAIRVGGRIVFNARNDYAIVRVYRRLIVAIRGIGLRSFCARFERVATCVLRITFRDVVSYPRGGTRIANYHVICRFFRICFLRGLRRVDLRIRDPSFVRGRVFGTVLEDGVGVDLMNYVICSNLRICTARIPIVPPFPNCFSQFSPKYV